MIDATIKELDQKAAVIKGVTPASRSRALALWIALLILYFLLLPTAAETPGGDAQVSSSEAQAARVAPAHRFYAFASRP
jgi:hypothetical protein